MATAEMDSLPQVRVDARFGYFGSCYLPLVPALNPQTCFHRGLVALPELSLSLGWVHSNFSSGFFRYAGIGAMLRAHAPPTAGRLADIPKRLQ